MQAKSLVLAGAFLALAGASAMSFPDAANGVITLDVPAGETRVYDVALPAASRLVKTGPGAARLTVDSTAFNGEVEVAEGVLLVSTLGAVGPSSPIAVTGDAATFHLFEPPRPADAGQIKLLFANHPVTIRGAGAEGQGAFRYTAIDGNVMDDNLIESLTLTADATIDVSSRWGVGGPVNLNGHTLRRLGGAQWMVWGQTVISPGEIESTDGLVTVQSHVTVTDPANTHLSITGGQFFFWDLNQPFDAPVTFTGGGAEVGSGSDSPWNAPGKATRNGFGQTVAVNIPNGEFHFNVGNPGEALSFHGPLNYSNTTHLDGNGNFYLHGPVRTDGDDTFLFINANGWVVATSDVERVVKHLFFKGGSTRFWLGGGTLSVGGMLRLGNWNWCSRVAFWQTGGEFHTLGDSFIGEGKGTYTYGAWVLEDGSATFHDDTHFGVFEGQGVLVQKGGSFTLAGGVLSFAKETGTATAYIAGGVNDTRVVSGAIDDVHLVLAPEGGVATLTVTGPDTLLKAAKVEIGSARAVVTNIVNISNGGTFEASRFICVKDRPAPSCVTVNADGGVLKPTFAYSWNQADAASESFFKYAPDHFVVHAGGLVVDTSDCRDLDQQLSTAIPCEFPFALSAPTGRRIASIALPTIGEFTELVYSAPAVIDIEGPAGSYGASAFADYDFRAGRLAGVVVTSGGCDYDETTRVYVYSPDGRTRHECAYTLEENAPGGALVKRGPVDLNIHAPQFHTGGTIVESGTLRLVNAESFPANTPAEAKEGAVLDLAGHDAAVSSLAGAGTVANGNVTVTARLEVTARELFARREPLKIQKACRLADGVTVVVRDPENLEDYKGETPAPFLAAAGGIDGQTPTVRVPEGVTGGWTVLRVGDTLRFGIPQGTILILR